MSEYAGSALVLWWLNTAGTLNMSPETRLFTLDPQQATVDVSAAHDSVPYLLPMLLDYSPRWSGVTQDGTLGTAYAQQLRVGTPGTLFFWPSGTASGNVEYIIPAYSLGLETYSPYSDVTVCNCAFGILSGETVFIGSMAVDGLFLEDGVSYWIFEDGTRIMWG